MGKYEQDQIFRFWDEIRGFMPDDTKILMAETGSCLRPSLVEQSLITIFEPGLRYFLGNETYEQTILVTKIVSMWVNDCATTYLAYKRNILGCLIG